MERKILIIVSFLLLLGLAACGNNQSDVPKDSDSNKAMMISAPAGSSDYIGRNYRSVISDLKAAGFTNIEVEIIEDLTSKSSVADETVEMVRIGELTEYAAKDEFDPSVSVVVTYHIIPKLNPPIGSESIQSKEYGEIAKEFAEVGFANISTSEVYDIDPDVNNANFVNEVTINGRAAFLATDQVPYDADINIVGHYPFSKHTVKLSVDFVGNWFFDKYGVNLLINGAKYANLDHGKDAEYEIRLKDEKYRFAFVNDTDSKVKGEFELDINCDVDAAYKIYCHSDYVEIEKIYVDYKRELAADEVKALSTNSSFSGMNCKEAESVLKGWGFTNISAVPVYDIYFGITTEESVASVSIGGIESFRNGDVFKKNAEVIIKYHMYYDKDPAKQTESTTSSGEGISSNSTTKPGEKKEFDIDRNMMLVRCERDSKYTTMYNVVFADTDKNGNLTDYYTFDTYHNLVNPRDMGKEFNAIGDLPSWFKVGNYVHVKANISGGGISNIDCSVTKPKEEQEISSIDNGSNENKMPVMEGTSLEEIKKVAAKYGVSHEAYTEDFGHGTKSITLDDNKNGVTLSVIYSITTEQVLGGCIVPTMNMSSEAQKDFINAMAKVLCPETDTDAVSDWVSSNLGKKVQTDINGFIYELSVGTANNIVYYAGMSNWERWDLSF